MSSGPFILTLVIAIGPFTVPASSLLVSMMIGASTVPIPEWLKAP